MLLLVKGVSGLYYAIKTLESPLGLNESLLCVHITVFLATYYLIEVW